MWKAARDANYYYNWRNVDRVSADLEYDNFDINWPNFIEIDTLIYNFCKVFSFSARESTSLFLNFVLHF